MSRDYAICPNPECGDMLPYWMDGRHECECGQTAIEVDNSVDCSACGRTVKEHDAAATHMAIHHPSGGSMTTWVHFCGECDPGLYQVLVVERPGQSIPDGGIRPEYEVVAGWLATVPRVPRSCGCGVQEDIGVIVLPPAKSGSGDTPLGLGGWTMRPACIRCVQVFMEDNGIRR